MFAHAWIKSVKKQNQSPIQSVFNTIQYILHTEFSAKKVLKKVPQIWLSK